MAMYLTLPNQYGYVLLCATLMGFSVIILGFIFVSRPRSKIFTEEFMKQNFQKQHQDAFGEQIKAGGYPDNGSGYYSSKITYKQWYEFNNAQRAHLNFIQWIATNLVLLLIGGLYLPIPSAAVGLGIIIARVIYGVGYITGGPASRVVGALFNDLLTLAQFMLGMFSSIKFILGEPFL